MQIGTCSQDPTIQDKLDYLQPLFELSGKPEVNKTSIKKNAKYLALMNSIVNF